MKFIFNVYSFFSFFSVILIASHVSRIQAVSDSLSKDSNLERSHCKSRQSQCNVMTRYMMVSSANSPMLLLI